MSLRGYVLVLLLAAAAGFGLARALAGTTPVSRDLAVQQRLMCPQCSQTRLDVCDRPICTDMKADIHRRLAAGEPEDSIVRGYAARYGDSVLAQPRGGVDVATLVPWVLAAAALALLISTFLRRAPPRRHSGAGA